MYYRNKRGAKVKNSLIITVNLIITIVAAVLLICYRTPALRGYVSMDVILLAVVASAISCGFMTVILLRNANKYQDVHNIVKTLAEVADDGDTNQANTGNAGGINVTDITGGTCITDNASDTGGTDATTNVGVAGSAINTQYTHINDIEDVDTILAKVLAIPAGNNSGQAGRGWNRLLTIIDKMQNDIQSIQAVNNMEQFLCSHDSQRLLRIIDSLSDGIILADSSGNIMIVNRVCEGLLGRSLGELVNCSLADILGNNNGCEQLRRFLSPGSGQKQTAFEVNLSEQSDATVLRLYCQKLGQNQSNNEILVVLRDITQQKISEKSRDDFIAHVSHELRSPLTNIRAYAETLLSDMVLDVKAQKEAFNVINEETIRLTRLVNDILDLSRMESGSLTLDAGEVFLDRLIRQCVNDLKGFAASKQITLQTNFHPKLPNLWADREKLNVSINNILSNAIKYTPSNGSVFVETNVDDNYVYIKVSDTGYGIAPEDLDRIFDKFYRVDRQETSEITGSGLGLAICKEIVTLHNGTISVKSELNNGTEMVIKLPLTMTGPVLGPAGHHVVNASHGSSD